MQAYGSKRWCAGASTHRPRRYDALQDRVHWLTAHNVLWQVALDMYASGYVAWLLLHF